MAALPIAGVTLLHALTHEGMPHFSTAVDQGPTLPQSRRSGAMISVALCIAVGGLLVLPSRAGYVAFRCVPLGVPYDGPCET